MDIEALKAEIQQMIHTNEQAVKDLAAQGIQVGGFDSIRLQILVETLFGDMDQPPRLLYEYQVQQSFTAAIEGMRKQAEEMMARARSEEVRSRLLDGVQMRIPPNGHRG